MDVCFFTVAVVVCTFFFFRCVSLLKKTPSTKGKKAKGIRAPVETIIANKNDAPYEIRNLRSPLVVKGKLLRFLVGVVFTPLGKWLFIDDTIKKSNCDLMGGEYIPEAPSYGDIPLAKNDKCVDDDAVNRKVLDKLDHSPQLPVDKFRYNTILDYHFAYKNETCTPTQVIKSALSAIAESNAATPPLLAVIEWDDSVVMAMAEASTERWKKKKPLSYLDGVPVAIKGEILLEPYSLMGGAKFKSAICENVMEGDLIKRLREAGAVLIGVTNMQEFGTGTLGSNPNTGTPRNPHNPAHYCGGSSSGSASSVAAGLCPLALGADGGGSVRIPASLCGVAGLKPTANLLDKSGVIPIAFTIGVVGPLASSSLDIAIAMDVFMKGSGKPFSLEGLMSDSLTGLRIGMYSEYFQNADKEVVSHCNDSIEFLKEFGAEVKEIVIPELEELRVAHLCLIASEMASNLNSDMDRHFDDLNPETLVLLRLSREYSSTEYINSLKQRARGLKIMEAIFSEVDLIVLPSSAIPAPKIHPGALSHGVIDATTSGSLMKFMFLANITGLPGISVPIGVSKERKLPIGLQIMAPWYKDGLLIKVGRMLEQKISAFNNPPQIYYDLLKN